MLRALKTIGMIFGTFIVVLLLTPWVLRGLGYYVDNTGGEIGRLAAEKHNVTLCKKIIVYSHVFGPPTMSRRGECVYTYAKLTKDPSACELLMPSSYGLSCVGAATKNVPCLFDDQKNVVWNDGKYNEIPFGECSKAKLSKEGTACCIAAAAKFNPDFVKGCEDFRSSNSLLADQCQYEVAQKEIDPVLCGTIADENIRSACNLEVTTLLSNPELRSNYPFLKKR